MTTRVSAAHWGWPFFLLIAGCSGESTESTSTQDTSSTVAAESSDFYAYVNAYSDKYEAEAGSTIRVRLAYNVETQRDILIDIVGAETSTYYTGKRITVVAGQHEQEIDILLPSPSAIRDKSCNIYSKVVPVGRPWQEAIVEGEGQFRIIAIKKVPISANLQYNYPLSAYPNPVGHQWPGQRGGFSVELRVEKSASPLRQAHYAIQLETLDTNNGHHRRASTFDLETGAIEVLIERTPDDAPWGLQRETQTQTYAAAPGSNFGFLDAVRSMISSISALQNTYSSNVYPQTAAELAEVARYLQKVSEQVVANTIDGILEVRSSWDTSTTDAVNVVVNYKASATRDIWVDLFNASSGKYITGKRVQVEQGTGTIDVTVPTPASILPSDPYCSALDVAVKVVPKGQSWQAKLDEAYVKKGVGR